MTGSGKTGLVAHESKFNFVPQTKKNYINSYTIKFHCHSQQGLSSLPLLATFPGKSFKQSETVKNGVVHCTPLEAYIYTHTSKGACVHQQSAS